MPSIHKRVITDEQSRPVSVVIPYQEWLEIEQVLLEQSYGTESSKLRAHEGVVRLREDPIVYQQQLREEWI
jgi:hypothetical protein